MRNFIPIKITQYLNDSDYCILGPTVGSFGEENAVVADGNYMCYSMEGLHNLFPSVIDLSGAEDWPVALVGGRPNTASLYPSSGTEGLRAHQQIAFPNLNKMVSRGNVCGPEVPRCCNVAENGIGGLMKRQIPTWLMWLALVLLAFTVGASCFVLTGQVRNAPVTNPITNPDTGIQLASQTTVLFPSTLAYAQQKALEAGTGLAGIDFIYCERQTGIDAVTLMAIAAHESAWGTNYWATKYNNVMSWGIGDSDPDRAYYDTKTQNVLAAAKGLKRLYLSENATYYGGDLTLYGVNKYYASDKGWAAGVIAIVKQIEAKLTETQRMKRWATKTGLFTPDVVWDEVHTVVGWSLYKMNNATAVAGR